MSTDKKTKSLAEAVLSEDDLDKVVGGAISVQCPHCGEVGMPVPSSTGPICYKCKQPFTLLGSLK